MKAVLSFFLLFCLQLFSLSSAHAVHQRTAGQHLTVKQVRTERVLQNAGTGIEQEKDFAVIPEDEDEDEIIRKQTSLPRYLSAFFSEIISFSFFSRSDNFHAYCGIIPAVSSRKYIFQRVLRI